MKLKNLLPTEIIQKILLIKLRAIGDVVLATIVLPNLRKAFPNAQIDFLTESESKEVLQGNPYVNNVIVLERKKIQSLPVSKALRENLKLMKKLQSAKYDLVLDLFGNPRSAMLTLLTGAPYRVGYNFRGRKFAYNIVVTSRAASVHEAEFHLDALRKLGIPIVERRLFFPLDKQNLIFIDEFFQEKKLNGKLVVGINPSGGWPAKRWPLNYFAELSTRLVKELGAEIILLWGPGELQEVMKLGNQMKAPYHLAPKMNLKQLAALIKKCHLVISNDSGPMHISAALGTPTVAIFGPTNSDLQGPYGEIHEVAKKLELDCLGCNRLTCETNSCMSQLTVDEVWKVVLKCLAKNNLLR